MEQPKLDLDQVDNGGQEASEAVGLDRIGRLALSDLVLPDKCRKISVCHSKLEKIIMNPPNFDKSGSRLKVRPRGEYQSFYVSVE